MEETKPLLKQGWLRALLFVISFLALSILAGKLVDRIMGISMPGRPDAASAKGLENNITPKLLLLQISISFIISLLTVFFFRKLIDKKTFTSLGLPLKNNLSHGMAGFFLGVFLLGAGSFILIANSNLQWTDIHFDARELFIGFGIMFIVAFAEELAFRGYILNNLMQSMNKWVALVITALVFAIFHLGNPGISAIAFLNVFLAGMVLGINYIFTKNLWFSILFHCSWNFYQGSVLGFKVSGIHLYSLLEEELNGNPLITGGSFGFEGSLIVGGLLVVTLLLLAPVFMKYQAERL